VAWARLGTTVTGLDFSAPAVDAAAALAAEVSISLARATPASTASK
jgi:2-polyprenyl-3-methyl-5-hydroxy-6-metoxy-1,4-benzoquinol methylase